MGRRAASVLTEIVIAFAVFAVMFVPLIGGFQTGARQTQGLRSLVTARGLCDWGLAQARGLVEAGFYTGLPCPGSGPLLYEELAPDAALRFPEAAAQLRGLTLARTIRCLEVGGPATRRVYTIEVAASWTDPEIARPRRLAETAVVGEQL